MKHIAKGREQICNKTFVKMMDELGYDAELTYKKKQQTEVAVNWIVKPTGLIIKTKEGEFLHEDI